jgi:hypothetical protein
MSEAVTNLEELKKLAPPAELRRAPVVEGNKGLGWLTDKLSVSACSIKCSPASASGAITIP